MATKKTATRSGIAVKAMMTVDEALSAVLVIERKEIDEDGSNWGIREIYNDTDQITISEDEKDDFIAALVELRRIEKEAV